MGTGTGLAPYLSIIKDPETYERFEQVIVAHGVRRVNDLAYRHYISEELPQHPLLGDVIREQLLYYPVVSREPFERNGRLTTLFDSGEMSQELGLPDPDPANDRVMLCGSQAMIDDFCALLNRRGFHAARAIGDVSDYVFERAFVG